MDQAAAVDALLARGETQFGYVTSERLSHLFLCGVDV